MNEENRIILYALKHIIERNHWTEEMREKLDSDICEKITDLVAPKKEQLINDKTNEILSDASYTSDEEVKE